jgi:hypothetical protein
MIFLAQSSFYDKKKFKRWLFRGPSVGGSGGGREKREERREK